MTARRCASCYAPIDELPAYARLCRPCFVTAKKTELADLQSEVAELRAENARLRAQRDGIEPTMVRRLLQLCHPDKHSGSTLAGEVTAWLLSIRAKVTQ